MDVAVTCSECWTWLRSRLQDQAVSGYGGSVPATAPQQTRSLTWLDCWLHNSLPDLVNFLARETQILVMYAEIQTQSQLSLLTAGEKPCLIKEKEAGKIWKKIMKRTHTGLH